MKDIRTLCIKERKVHIQEDAQVLLFAAEQYLKELKLSSQDESHVEAVERMRLLLAYMDDIVEALEAVPDLLGAICPPSFELLYRKQYQNLINQTTLKAYPMVLYKGQKKGSHAVLDA